MMMMVSQRVYDEGKGEGCGWGCETVLGQGNELIEGEGKRKSGV
jgi:hypothetical protein